MKKNISIIIPVYNEELSLEKLYLEVKETIDQKFNNHEIIFINDGSTDASSNIIKKISSNDSNVILIDLNRNYGKSDALNEGFKLAQYNYIVTLDADLQDDPKEINNLIDILDNGYDCVSGWKKNRKDPLSKTIPSFFFNKFINFFSGLKLHDLNCGIKAYKKNAIKALNILKDLEKGEMVNKNYSFSFNEIKKNLNRRSLFYAALLHDIGKGKGGEHNKKGKEISKKIVLRLGENITVAKQTAKLVYNHSLLSDVAFKQDFEDHSVIRHVTQKIKNIPFTKRP